MSEFEKQFPQPKYVSVSPELHKKIKLMAVTKGISLKQLIEEAILAYTQKNDKA